MTSPEIQLGEERPPADEQQTIEEILEFQLGLMRQVGPGVRGQHPKGHGCVRAEFAVEASLPSELQRGVFQEPKTFPALIRFSNGFTVDDRAPDFHGMAIKLLGVPGQKLLDGEESALTQDFILADTPVFFTANVKRLLVFMQTKVQFAAEGLSEEEQIGKLAVACPEETELFLKHVQPTPSNPLAASYWSCTPYRLGAETVKYQARPIGNELASEAPDEHSLRQAMKRQLANEGVQFEFAVQRQTDAISMPIEDATKVWSSPFERVATITIPPQTFDSAAQLEACEALSFNPWHCLQEHRPLGGLNRARRAVYSASSRLRHEETGSPSGEPSSLDDFPDA